LAFLERRAFLDRVGVFDLDLWFASGEERVVHVTLLVVVLQIAMLVNTSQIREVGTHAFLDDGKVERVDDARLPLWFLEQSPAVLQVDEHAEPVGGLGQSDEVVDLVLAFFIDAYVEKTLSRKLVLAGAAVGCRRGWVGLLVGLGNGGNGGVGVNGGLILSLE